jgi:putative ABC transport system permease protein
MPSIRVISPVRQSLRSLRRDPWSSGVVVVSLAAGFAAAILLFAVTDSLFFRPPAGVREPHMLRRVWVYEADSAATYIRGAPVVSYRDFDVLRARLRGGPALAAYATTTLRVELDGRVADLRAAVVSGNYFETVGARAAAGRGISSDDERAAAAGVVISERLWTRHFARARTALGSTLVVNGLKLPIIGIAARGFTGVEPTPLDLWLPLGAGPSIGIVRQEDQRTADYLSLLLRARNDGDSSVVRATIDAGLVQLHDDYPGSASHRSSRLGAITRHQFERQSATPSRIPGALLFMVGLLLAVGCGNAIVMLLMRVLRREVELATRVALGAGGRQLLLEAARESALLVGAGILASVVLIMAAARRIPAAFLSPGTTILHSRVALFVLGTAVAATTACLLPSTVFARRAGISAVLRAAGAGSRLGFTVRRVCHALLLIQTTLMAVLLMCAVMLVGNVWRAAHLDLGFQPRGVYALLPSLDPSSAQMTSGLTPGELVLGTRRRIEAAVRSLPDVEGASWTQSVPLKSARQVTFALDESNLGATMTVLSDAVGPDYFQTVGIPLLGGRTFSASDGATRKAVVIVNATLARMLAGAASPIGSCLPRRPGETGCTEIVGVAGNIRYLGIWAETAPAMYVPFSERSLSSTASYLVRIRPGAGNAGPRLQSALRQVGLSPSAVQLTSLESLLDEQTAQWQLGASAFVFGGATALIVALIGVYCVVAFEVAQRRGEVGIRMALGCPDARILWSVSSRALGFGSAGVMLGTAAGIGAANVARHLVNGLEPVNAWWMAASALALTCTCVAASLLPARRALRTSPNEALRST